MGQLYIRRTPGGDYSQHKNIEVALSHVSGNAVAFIEDDDWYGPDFLSEMMSLLASARIAGFGHARKYNVRERLYRLFNNRWHACLARTAIRCTLLDTLRRVLRRRPKYIDMELWRLARGRKAIGHTRQHIGIKGLPGREGIEPGHRPNVGWGDPDPEGVVLKEWVPTGHEVYAPFYRPSIRSIP